MYKVTCSFKHSLPRTFQIIKEYYIKDGMFYLKNIDDYAWYLPLESILEIQIEPYKAEFDDDLEYDEENYEMVDLGNGLFYKRRIINPEIDYPIPLKGE